MRRIIAFFDRLLGVPPARLEKLIQSPDELVAEGLIRKIKQDFDAWKVESIPEYGHWSDHELRHSFYKKKTDWLKKHGAIGYSNSINKVLIGPDTKLLYRMEVIPYPSPVEKRSDFVINGIPLDDAWGLCVILAYNAEEDRRAAEKAKLAKAEAEAAKIAKQMADDQKKWDLAEKLLGMKRDETGALRPAVVVE